jgi:F0F1-type ATP synthase assembly protein I
LLKLSENVTLVGLRDRIVDAARNERYGLLIVTASVVLISAGLIISAVGDNSVSSVAGILAAALGTISLTFGFYHVVSCSRRYNKLLEEFYAVATSSSD